MVEKDYKIPLERKKSTVHSLRVNDSTVSRSFAKKFVTLISCDYSGTTIIPHYCRFYYQTIDQGKDCKHENRWLSAHHYLHWEEGQQKLTGNFYLTSAELSWGLLLLICQLETLIS